MLSPCALSPGFFPCALLQGLFPCALSQGLFPCAHSQGLFPCAHSQGLFPCALSQGLFPCALSQGLFPCALWQGLFPCSLLQWLFPVLTSRVECYLREKKHFKTFFQRLMEKVCIMFGANPFVRSNITQYHLEILQLFSWLQKNPKRRETSAAKGHLRDYSRLSHHQSRNRILEKNLLQLRLQ